MATPQFARPSTPARPSRQQVPGIAFCHHQHRGGQFCNRSAHPELRYCVWHLRGIPKKIVSLAKSAKLLLVR